LQSSTNQSNFYAMKIIMVIQKNKGFLPKVISREQAKDTAMAMALICLIIGYMGHHNVFVLIAALVLFAAMLWPAAFVPAAKLWFGFSHLLGTLMSKVVLTILFFVIVTPVGLMRRLAGADAMQMKHWKKGRASVFKARNHRYTPDDMRHPY